MAVLKNKLGEPAYTEYRLQLFKDTKKALEEKERAREVKPDESQKTNEYIAELDRKIAKREEKLSKYKGTRSV